MKPLASLLLLVLCVFGCGEQKQSRATPTASAPRNGLYENDKPLKHQPALAVGTEGETSWRVTIPTGEGIDCAKLLAAYPDRPDGGAYAIDFWLRRPIEPDGQASPWAIRSAFAYDGEGDGGRGMTTRGALIDDVAKIPEGLKLSGLELACQDQARHFQYSGDLPVKICGRKQRPEEDRPQPELKLSVADLPIEVHGASVRPEAGKLYLRLTRAPHECASAFTEGYDFYLDVALVPGKEDAPPKVAFASLQGDAFPGDPSGSKGKEAFVLKPADDLRGTGEVEIEVDGTLELSGYPVVMKGKMTALRCTPVGASISPSASPSASAPPKVKK